MASSSPHTILLKTATNEFLQKELRAGIAGILPGDLLDISSGSFIPFSGAKGVNAIPRFALESAYSDDHTVAAINDPYAASDTVFSVIAQEGDEVYAWLADGESVSVGDKVVAAGSAAPGDLAAAGTAAATGATIEAVIGRAMEAVTASGSHARLRIEVMS